jgi:hypothetical protein
MVSDAQEKNEHFLRYCFLAGTVLYVLFFIGIYRAPGSVNEWLHLSQIGLTGGDHWGILSHTYSLPTLARAIGISTPEAWRSMVELIAIFAIGLLIHTLNKFAERSIDFLILLMLVVFAPVTRAVLNGQADYDGLTLIGLSLVLMSIRSDKTFAAIVFASASGLIFGTTNPQQSAVSLGCLAATMFALQINKYRQLVYSLIMLFLSSAVIRIFLRDEDIIGRDRGFFGGGWMGITDWERLLNYLPHIFAGMWVLIAMVLFSVYQTRGIKRSLIVSVTVVVLPLVIMVPHGDGSRIFALVMMPAAAVALAEISSKWSTRKATIICLTAIALQIGYVSLGQLKFEPQFPTVAQNLSTRPNPLPNPLP